MCSYNPVGGIVIHKAKSATGPTLDLPALIDRVQRRHAGANSSRAGLVWVPWGMTCLLVDGRVPTKGSYDMLP